MNFQPYSYCFLRYHHTPESGEFVNVGVLLWAPVSHFLGFKSCHRYLRLSKFFADFDNDGYRQMMTRIDSRFERLGVEWEGRKKELPNFEERPPSAREVAFSVIPQDDAALQWSLSSGGETTDPQAELEQIYETYIERHNPKSEHGRRDESLVYREIFRQAFVAPSIAKYITPHEVRARLDHHTFKDAWKNGRWNVYETLAFDLIEPEAIRSKALKWDSRANHLSDAEGTPQLHYMLGKPEGSRNAVPYGKAKDILASSGRVTLIEEDEADDFATALKAAILAVESTDPPTNSP